MLSVPYRLAIGFLVAFTSIASPTAAQEQPARGGTLVFGINSGDPPTYDCHQSVLFPIIHLLTPHYSNLLKIDTPNYPKIIGDLAQGWTVADDAKTYTFKLVSVRRGLLADIDAIETPDPLTVVFRLKQPNRALIYAFANPFNCVYSAAKLKENPLYPARNVMGTGPFRFVEHVGGSHWIGERFKDYFKPGLPYLDGFRAVFTQGAALINALQGGQIMADFRSVTTADRDRLVAALGDRITVQESPWLNVLLVTFNTKKPPFNDPRVRRALSLAIDRWRASEVLTRSSIMRYVGGYLRPGSEFAAREEDLVRMPGFSRDIEASRAEARRLLAAAGVPNLKVKLINRMISNLFTPAGIYVIDQWRQIGVETEHVQANEVLYNNSMNDGTFDVALDFQGDSVDEPTYQFARHISVDLSSNRGGYTDRALDELFDRQKDLTDPRERYRAVRAFEQRMLEESYTVPLLWWQRIVVMRSSVKGWGMTPSHLIGQDLETVWLKP
jgi:peptide/nickel transport system substrate-binding protein